MLEYGHSFEFNCGIFVKQQLLCFNKALVSAQLTKRYIPSAIKLTQDSCASCELRQVGIKENVRLRHVIQNAKNPRLIDQIDKRWRLIGLESRDCGRENIIVSNSVHSWTRTVTQATDTRVRPSKGIRAPDTCETLYHTFLS